MPKRPIPELPDRNPSSPIADGDSRPSACQPDSAALSSLAGKDCEINLQLLADPDTDFAAHCRERARMVVLFGNDLRIYARRMGASEDVAEDVVSRVWERFDRGIVADSVSGLGIRLRKATQSEYLNRVRSEKRAETFKTQLSVNDRLKLGLRGFW